MKLDRLLVLFAVVLSLTATVISCVALMRDPLGTDLSKYNLSSPEAALRSEVLTDERFTNDWSAKMSPLPSPLKAVMQHMLHRDPPDHTRLRRLAHKTFTPSSIDLLRGRIQVV